MRPNDTSDDLPKHDQHGAGWALQPKLAALKERDDRSGFPSRELGVTWKGLTVQVASPDTAIHENVISQFNIPKIAKQSRRKPPMKTILEDSFGCVKPGEMLLVLGRPGQYIGPTIAPLTTSYPSSSLLTHIRRRIRMHNAPQCARESASRLQFYFGRRALRRNERERGHAIPGADRHER